MPVESLIDLSRLQFALTALYHFLFVPLTLGLSVLLVIMEAVYLMTNKEIWKDMVKFWGTLFGINFVMGVATGITMEFQFGMNWANFSRFVGDIFGAPLAIEGLMAFFLEATFVGLFFFGWERLSKRQHFLATLLLALGTNLSALWILIANGWMQNPIGAVFNIETMRMEVASFYTVMFNDVAQAKFVHTVSAGYVLGSIFVLSISAYYLLNNRNIALAKRSMVVASAFGLATSLAVVLLGDESGYLANHAQKMKIAAIEGMWHTEKPPASLSLFGLPDNKEHITRFDVRIPYLLGIIATRSFDQPVEGIIPLVDGAKKRIKKGIVAYSALQQLRVNKNDNTAKKAFTENSHYLGYALLLKRYTNDIIHASAKQIDQAAWSTVPNVEILFWAFRIMVGCGFFFIFMFIFAFYCSTTNQFKYPLFLKTALYSLPLPWIAIEFGWIVAEYGRQPWVVQGMLPTFSGASTLSIADVSISLGGFVLFYTTLLIVDIILMKKYIKKGPEEILGHSWEIDNRAQGDKHYA